MTVDLDRSDDIEARERVLIVDDDESFRDALGQLLMHANYRCSIAGGPEEAHERLKERPFDLLLADISMPGGSGLGLVRKTLAEHPDMAAIMITGMDSPDLAETAAEFGACGYIVKPFSSSQVLPAIANAMKLHRLQAERRANSK